MTKSIHSIHQITSYPLDLSGVIYQEYPFLKLGVVSSVQHYAEILMPVVEEIMAANPQYTSWVLTSPPRHRLPAAANLLCWAVYEGLKNKSKIAAPISLLDLHNQREEKLSLKNAQDFNNYNDYSKYSWEDRLKLKRKHNFVIKEEDFIGQGIVFINDINVTGAGQEYIRQIFSTVYPYEVNWVYILDCDPSVGRKEPQLESEINNFKILTIQDFATVLALDDISFTTKCISKLFSYNTGEIEQILSLLNEKQKTKLWSAVVAEELYDTDFFKDKMERLRV
ncbi:MAG: phosphoribosyltransferase family protein [Saprospiraceae bacterium]